MYRPNWLVKFIVVCLCSSLLIAKVLAQTPTPTPAPTAPWWWQPEGDAPYWVTLLVALLIFVFGGLARPLIELAGNRLLLWVQGWGKVGRFQQHYLTWLIGQYRYLPDLRPNIVGGRWEREYTKRTLDLEELFIPLSMQQWHRLSPSLESQTEFEEDWEFEAEDERSQPSRPQLFTQRSKRDWSLQRWLVKQWQRLLPSHEAQAEFADDLVFGEDDETRTARRRRLSTYWPIQQRSLQRWLVKQRQRLRPPIEPKAGDIGTLIQHQRQLVILGDPGSGKTTLLRYLALTCARSLRNDRKDGDNAKMVYTRLGWRKRPFPILISLNLLSDVTTWSTQTKLLAEIVKTLTGELRAIYPAGFFEQQLNRGNCLVLFDGFDELGSREARSLMARQIADLTHAYNKTTNCFIVSSRIVGYERQLNQYGFQERTIQELDTDAVHILIRRSYRAIALSEALGRSAQEEVDLNKRFDKRAEELIRNLDRNRGLQKLTPNPLILSLIVLVHMVKIDLPDERHLLYRDCVEILTEKWQIVRSDPAGLLRTQDPDDLVLRDKIEILRALALTMQKQRHPGGDQILMVRAEMEKLIAKQLPHFIGSKLPAVTEEREQVCERKASDLLENIHHKSGILTEKGHNNVGDPVVGFSHLTFLEYLAADAIRQQPDELPYLIRNLFHAAWRETLLLYVGMGNAAPVIEAALADPAHTTLTRLLLAGRCLTEKITLEPTLQRQILQGLSAYLLPPTTPPFTTIEAIITLLGKEQRYDWLLENLDDLLQEEEVTALAAAVTALTPGQKHPLLQQTLLRAMHAGEDMNARQMLGSLLGAIGDPRDLDEMVTVPAGEFTMGDERGEDEQPIREVTLDTYQIAKYPVTNAQYQRFVLATGHRPARGWRDGQPEPRKLNHPVTDVSWHDAVHYCAWLSQETGRTFRLPSEAEWEKAARGAADIRLYPWGDAKPTAQLCNYAYTVGDTTPVGMYPAGASPYGCLDMAGNVWEWTSSLYKAYPYDPTDGRENQGADGRRTLRGGAFVSNDNFVRCAFRVNSEPDFRNFRVGFRVVSPGAVER